MQKRLSKLALLAIAAAFIVAGFPACSDDDEDGEPPAQATATFALTDGDSVALTAGEPKDVAATLTVTNTAFSDAVKTLDADAPLADYITLTAGEKVSITDVKVAEKANDTTMKITFTVAADDGAENGTITAALKAAALTATKDDVAAMGTISYTVTAADPDAPKATFTGDNIPTDGVSLTTGEEKTGDATITVTNTTFSDAVKALNEGDAIPDTFLTLNAGDKVTVSGVKVATKATDTTMKITLTVTAGENTGSGEIKATLKAAALTAEKDVAASGAISYTVKDGSKPDETVYFTSFVASKDLDKTADSTAYEPLTSKDGLVTMGRTKYQIVSEPYTTIDYDEEAGSGYTYTARVKVNKTNNDGEGKLTIKSVKVGAILRIDGGNASSGVRKMEITGADETVWAAGAQGSFYLTATANTIVFSSVDNEFCIYGIHVVNEKVAETVVNEETTYVAPTLTLSATSVVKGEEVTATAKIPDATKTTTYSTGKVASETVPVTADITYDGATMTGNKVDTSEEKTLTITASYTVGEDTYTSAPVTLEVTGAFAEQEEKVANDDDTLGLTATTVTSADESIATAKLSVDNANIVITSKAKGPTTITASDGTNSAKIDVTVKANGEIETKVHKYNPNALTGTWTALDYAPSTIKDKTSISTGTVLGNVSVEGTGAQWRASGTTKWTSLELGKAAGGCLKFEVGAESGIVVEAASTGSSNTSDIVLCTKSDGTGTVTGSATTVTGTSYIKVTFDTVSAGTYYLGAFPASSNGRGVRIQSITVTAK